MIINGLHLLEAEPIAVMAREKLPAPGGTSYGLGEAGYDIRIKQRVVFDGKGTVTVSCIDFADRTNPYGERAHAGRFTLASAMELFQMPDNLVGVVHDKSTWARRGLSVFNTVIEPGWRGFLTLELVYHGEGQLVIPEGAGIAQVLFSQTAEKRTYAGKYQNQPDQPVAAIDTPPKG